MSLATRLQREIKANPTKAAGLGVLVLVACYFWAPLIAGFIKPAEDPAAAPPAAPAAPAMAAAAEAPQGQAAQTSTAGALTYDWRKIARLIDEDAKMHPAAELTQDRDPFTRPTDAPPPAAEQTAAQPVVEAKPVTPAEAGLMLTTTLLGAHTQIAEINDKSYSIGDRVEVLSEALRVSFRVVEIHPRRVVLESHGERYELTIPRPLLDAVAGAVGSQRATRDSNDSEDTGDSQPPEQRTSAESADEESTDATTN